MAEAGTGKSEGEQIAAAKLQLHHTFPWLNFSSAQWHSFFINRAEAKVDGKHRPDDAIFVEENNAIVAFPTKFTLTPSLADKLVEHLAGCEIEKGAMGKHADLNTHLQAPSIAHARWEF